MKAQERFLEMVHTKAYQNDYVQIGEKTRYRVLLNKAVLGQAQRHWLYYQEGNNKIVLGPAHTVALQLGSLNKNTVKLSRYEFVKIVPISELWKILIAELPFIFPSALEEALKISGDLPKGEEGTSFDWSSEKGMKQ